jgi:hypothetical protein
MATQVQFRRGTTTQNNAFTGANGEISVDTDVKTIRLHDGVTGGGASIMMNTTTSQTALNKTFSTGSVWTGSAVGLAYGGTGSSLSAVQGAVAYSGASGLGLSAAGTSGQVLVSGGTGSPVWVNASSLTTGVATTAVTATNIAGGSAGQLIIQSDTNLSTFITAGAEGTFLKSAGAGYAPTWAAGQVTLGSSDVPLGSTATTLASLTSITMQNGSYGGGTINAPGITGTGPWTATITGMSSTTGINVGQYITAAAGTGSLFGGSPTSVVVASVVSGTSITVTVTGGTTPTAGTITSITTFGYLQVPVGTTAQRPWVAATGMIRYNSTTVGFEGYSSGSWSSLGGVSSVDKLTYIRAETSAGASNGELEFFVEDSAGTAAVKAMGIDKDGVTIAGNLTVNGTTITINSTSLSIEDNIIRLAEGNTGNAVDIGFVGNYTSGSAYHTGLIKQASTSKWLLLSGVAEPGNTISLTGASYDALKVGSLEAVGDITSPNFYSVSDERLKSNIVDSPYGLTEVMQLRSVAYDMDGRHEVGLLAQNVEQHMPEFVSTDADGTKKLDYAKMVSVLVKTVQQQQEQIEELKARLG